MCGIAGVSLRDGRPPPPETLAALGQALAHRGPDGAGTTLQGDVALVHRRLAIVDLKTGDQPLFDPANVALIANGEIYNDLELRAGTQGYATGSDCESALRLYIRDGVSFAGGLRGMYAIAIHDRRDGTLILSRDPFGIKPLYYAETSAGFWFASEPQALVAAGACDARLNTPARDRLLALQFSPGTETPFAGINRVQPGETIVVRAGRIGSRTRIPAIADVPQQDISETEAMAAFAEAFEDSVRVHQRSDVPYGMFLSGGIDSSAVLAVMARLNERPVLAYTAAFPGTAVHDERAAARAVAQACRAQHVEVEVTADDFWRDLPAICAAVDDAAADYAIVPSYLLAKRAKRDVKVILTGEGGDELLAGYGRYRAAARPWPFRRKPWRKSTLGGLGVLRTEPPQWRAGIDALEAEAGARDLSRLARAQAVDIGGWLPDDLLIKLDRCLMAHGIEGRVPFLDPKVAAATFPLPDRLKVAGGQGKWLLRKWLATTLDAAQPFARKRGFTVPVAAWIAASPRPLGPLLAAQPGIAEVCQGEAVTRLFASTDPKLGHARWLLLFYALWHNRHILGRSADGNVFDALAA